MALKIPKKGYEKKTRKKKKGKTKDELEVQLQKKQVRIQPYDETRKRATLTLCDMHTSGGFKTII
jgi:UDP-3-O-acyl-N-acetylglucosamine deacetylase